MNYLSDFYVDGDLLEKRKIKNNQNDVVELSMTDVLVYCYMKYNFNLYRDMYRPFTETQEFIADRLGCSRRTVLRSIDKLTKAGLITKNVKTVKGFHTKTEWFVSVPNIVY